MAEQETGTNTKPTSAAAAAAAAAHAADDTTTTNLSPPTNTLVSALLTDLYQITMTYAHWKNNRHNDPAVFELFFRKNPFGGEYTIFAGLDECLKHLQYFHFSDSDIAYLQNDVPSLNHCDAAFFEWLRTVDASQVQVRAMRDGTVCFPRVPLMAISAPLAVGQLLETTFLTLVNYPSLLATNAARMVLAAEDKTPPVVATATTAVPLPSGGGSSSNGNNNVMVSEVAPPSSESADGSSFPAQCYKRPVCVEFGLRRAQGPDGGFSGSKYAAVGGFAGTSNVQAGKLLGLPISGTHAHAYVQAYSSLDGVEQVAIPDKKKNADSKEPVLLLPRVLEYRQQLAQTHSSYYQTTNDGELAAFISYAAAFPDSFLCLIDTYDTLSSGLLNFIMVALVLDDLGYTPRGIRLDSGDLAYLSMECAKVFHTFSLEQNRSFMKQLDIVASNDINEAVLNALNKQHHAITVYGIGTNLVTCQAQPALGCVYKLVEIAGKPRMKLSQDIAKVLVPGKKKAFRLIGKDDRPLLDVMLAEEEPDPVPHQRILCRHPFVARKRAAVTPTRVEPLQQLVFSNGQITPGAYRTLTQAKQAVQAQLKTVRPDVLRYINPTPYKVSVSDQVFTFLHELWQSETPVAELS